MSFKLAKLFKSALGTIAIRYQCLRSLASRADCAPDIGPPCSPENTAKKTCNIDRLNELMASSFFNKECCNNPCPDAYPRFDDLYYSPSDKRSRKYQQTWCEPPDIKIAPKHICTYEVDNLPLPEVRSRKSAKVKSAEISGDAKEQNLGLMQCRNVAKTTKCMKLYMAGCPPVRSPPKCKKTRPMVDCEKVCAPYPAYSECIRDDPPPRRPVECNCLLLQGFCHPDSPLVKRPK